MLLFAYSISPRIVIQSIDFFRVECKSPSEHFANIEADLIVEIKPHQMIIWLWLLVIVNCCDRVKGTCHLEHFTQFILEKLVWTAVMIKAEARQIKHCLFNDALRLDIVVDVVQQTKEME